MLRYYVYLPGSTKVVFWKAFSSLSYARRAASKIWCHEDLSAGHVKVFRFDPLCDPVYVRKYPLLDLEGRHDPNPGHVFVQMEG